MSKNASVFSDPELNTEIEKNTKRKVITSGSVSIKPGDDIIFITIVLKGSIRIIRQDREGKEVFLHHLYPGQTCAMSLT
jgi:CRP/FNR family transcriptional regulator